MTNSQSSRASSIAADTLIFLSGLAVVISELLKFARVPAVVNQMTAAGFSGAKILLVATLGFSSAILFLLPRTRSIGVLLLSSFLGGAICLHVQRDEYTKALAPALLLTLAWIGTFLRHRQMLLSLDWDRGSRTYSNNETRALERDDIG
jgi:hypothetical protein